MLRSLYRLSDLATAHRRPLRRVWNSSGAFHPRSHGVEGCRARDLVATLPIDRITRRAPPPVATWSMSVDWYLRGLRLPVSSVTPATLRNRPAGSSFLRSLDRRGGRAMRLSSWRSARATGHPGVERPVAAGYASAQTRDWAAGSRPARHGWHLSNWFAGSRLLDHPRCARGLAPPCTKNRQAARRHASAASAKVRASERADGRAFSLVRARRRAPYGASLVA